MPSSVEHEIPRNRSCRRFGDRWRGTVLLTWLSIIDILFRSSTHFERNIYPHRYSLQDSNPAVLPLINSRTKNKRSIQATMRNRYRRDRRFQGQLKHEVTAQRMILVPLELNASLNLMHLWWTRLPHCAPVLPWIQVRTIKADPLHFPRWYTCRHTHVYSQSVNQPVTRFTNQIWHVTRYLLQALHHLPMAIQLHLSPSSSTDGWWLFSKNVFLRISRHTFR